MFDVIGFIVISFSRCCLPNDEGPAPQYFFPRTTPGALCVYGVCICVYQISASGEKMYHDAYTLQKVEPEHLSSFNFAAGMVPFLLNLIMDVRYHTRICVNVTYENILLAICRL